MGRPKKQSTQKPTSVPAPLAPQKSSEEQLPQNDGEGKNQEERPEIGILATASVRELMTEIEKQEIKADQFLQILPLEGTIYLFFKD